MMRPFLSVLAALVLGSSLAFSLALPVFAASQVLRVAVTTSFENSGLADVLLPVAEDDLDIDIQLIVVGTGQALKLGTAGDVDAVLVHSKAAEEAFVNGGHGLRRTEIMFNDFVLIGPRLDPANVGAANTIGAALSSIAAVRSVFVSRGDDSGTHKKELALWDRANVSTFAPHWYRETGSGMGAALNTAAGLNAYILSDRATWLKFGNKADLALLYSGDPALRNQYAYLPVNPAKHPHIAQAAALAFEAWLISSKAQALIDGYQVAGQKLFTANAKQR
ncbi:MAG: substrate-binding domain-containing protein [Pseudomonadota bacterium]